MAKLHVTDPGFAAETSYSATIQGGTLSNPQPTFNGAPLFDASYSVSGSIVHFRISVLFTNITGFGTGQYYMTLPFNAKYEYYFRGGVVTDFSTSKKYSISGHVSAGSSTMTLFSTAANGDEVAFTKSVPFNLAVEDDFHIWGEYFRENAI